METPELYRANGQLMESLALFIPAAVAAMQRLDNTLMSNGQPTTASNSKHVDLLATVWALVGSVCTIHNHLIRSALFATPKPGTSLSVLLTQPLLEALRWLADFAKRGPAAHRALPQAMGVDHVWYRGIHMCMQSVLAFLPLPIIFCSPPDELQEAIIGIPSGFFAALCSLACEAAPGNDAVRNLPREVQTLCWKDYTNFVNSLQVVLHKIIASHTVMTGSTLHPEMLNPATVAAVQRLARVCGKTPCVPPDTVQDIKNASLRMMQRAPRVTSPIPKPQQQPSRSAS